MFQSISRVLLAPKKTGVAAVAAAAAGRAPSADKYPLRPPKHAKRPDLAAAPPPPPPAQHATVVFRQSGEAADWTPVRGTLLEFAESKGLSPPYSCRAGHCGSCATRISAGRVTYAEPTAWRPADDEVLLCCAVPASQHIELEL